MDKELGMEYTGIDRTNFLKDNCDAVESINYSKEFTPEKMEQVKEHLADVAVQIHDVNEDKKEAMSQYKDQLKCLGKDFDESCEQMKAKAEVVTEACFRFTEKGETGYYNNAGKLVYLRKATPKEMERTIQSVIRGDNNNESLQVASSN